MTKVAVVSQGSPDMLADIVADGMIRLLGRENVHLQCSVTSTTDSVKSHFFRGFAEPNAVEFHDTEALVISTRSSPETAREWRRRTGGARVAWLDGEDEPWFREECLPEGKVYFKRELLEGAGGGGILPLPFGAIPEDVPPPEERSGVHFRFKDTDPVRGQVAEILRSRGIHVDGGIMPKDTYNIELWRSLVGVSCRGVGWDTYRYWETAYWGAALLAQRPRIQIPGNFRDIEECVFFEDAGNFHDKLNWLLVNPDKAAAIGEAGRRACLERHLSTHRAKRVLEALL